MTNEKLLIVCAGVCRKMFQEEVSDWMQEVTGITLNSKVAMTCSRYDYTDVLLCHDDELDTRRIAFILYLVPPWKEEDGGALHLFDMDGTSVNFLEKCKHVLLS